MRTARRVGGVVAVVVGVTLIAFLLSYLSPTDPATRFFTDHGVTASAEQLAAKRHELGLDRPFFEQYASWLTSVLSGDLGTSFRSGRSVGGSLISCMPYTLALACTSLALTLAISVPLGLACAARKDGPLDNTVRLLSYAFCSLPSFFVALALLYVFSARLHVFPVRSTPDAAGIVLPTLALALPLSAWYVRQVRTVALEQLGAPYVDGLRSRGIPQRQILRDHVLRNVLAPILSLVGISLGSLLGGSAIVESIFSWPGVGNLSVAAIGARDYPLIQGYALLMAVVYLVVNAAIQALCHRIDPRWEREQA